METSQIRAERPRIRTLLLAVGTAALLTGMAASPARADRDDWHGRDKWHGHEQREHEWREHEWRERYWPYGYAAPGYPAYGYAPPPVIYAPPPYYVAPPPVAGLNFVLPLR
jgi:hypothetical protein